VLKKSEDHQIAYLGVLKRCETVLPPGSALRQVEGRVAKVFRCGTEFSSSRIPSSTNILRNSDDINPGKILIENRLIQKQCETVESKKAHSVKLLEIYT